jgi:hypothetical protein
MKVYDLFWNNCLTWSLIIIILNALIFRYEECAVYRDIVESLRRDSDPYRSMI